MADELLTVSRDGDIARLTLRRAPANVLDTGFLNAIADALDGLDADPHWRALVITGSDTIFSAGVDLKQVPDMDVAAQDDLVNALNRAYTRLYGLDRPTVAAMTGHAIAGGLILALCCDYRIASTGSCRFGLTEVKVGVAFPVSALEIARAELSPTVFRRFLLFGGLIGPDTALSDGVVDEIVEHARVLARAAEQARSFATLPKQGFAAVKAQMRAATLTCLKDSLDNGNEPCLGGWVSDEARAAATRVLAGKA